MAARYATAQLQARLSGQLGVDLLTIQSSSSNGGSALLIGKYLSRRALLTYEQTLAEKAAFLVSLEYFLSHHLKLGTFVGHHDQSGVELQWEKDY